MKKLLLIFIALLSLNTAMAKKSNFQIMFGSSGGFTNVNTTYTLNSDRTFSKEDNVSHKKDNLDKVKAKDISDIRKLVEAVNFKVLNINKTGNMNSFITYIEDGKESKTVWSGSTSGNPALDALNSKLQSLIPHK